MKIGATATALMLFATGASAGDGYSVTLSPTQQHIKQGERPQFVVTVEATSPLVRVARLDQRRDLRDNMARLIVTRNGAVVDLVPYISDPGPLDDADFVDLRLGEKLSFTHDGSPFPLYQLPPGIYSATVKLRAAPSLSPTESNAVSFQVKGP